MRISSDVPREKETVGTKLLYRAECAVATAIQHDSWESGTWITRRGNVAGRASLVAGLTPQPNLRRRWAFFGDRSSLCGETSITLVLLALFFREASEKRIVCIRKRLHKYLQSI
jgi:hypothetical protein